MMKTTIAILLMLILAGCADTENAEPIKEYVDLNRAILITEVNGQIFEYECIIRAAEGEHIGIGPKCVDSPDFNIKDVVWIEGHRETTIYNQYFQCILLLGPELVLMEIEDQECEISLYADEDKTITKAKYWFKFRKPIKI